MSDETLAEVLRRAYLGPPRQDAHERAALAVLTSPLLASRLAAERAAGKAEGWDEGYDAGIADDVIRAYPDIGKQSNPYEAALRAVESAPDKDNT